MSGPKARIRRLSRCSSVTAAHEAQARVPNYPISGSELARLLLRDDSRIRTYTREDYKFVQDGVRAKLREFGCPKRGHELRSGWVVDEQMARRVGEALGYSIP